MGVSPDRPAFFVNPEFLNAYRALGNLLSDQGRAAEALNVLRRYVEIAGEDARQDVLDRVAQLEAQVGS